MNCNDENISKHITYDDSWICQRYWGSVYKEIDHVWSHNARYGDKCYCGAKRYPYKVKTLHYEFKSRAMLKIPY